MPRTRASRPRILSARPGQTAEIMGRTGLDEAVLTDLVHGFYYKVRQDPVLGPVFEARIADWEPHLEKMVAFWSSVALMTGRYHGAPVPKHAGLPVTWAHFERWLHIFRETAREVCPPAGAIHVIERAERIARSLHMAVEDAARDDAGSAPRLRSNSSPPQGKAAHRGERCDVTSTAERMRSWSGPAVLSYGFRPFFLGAALWSALAMELWIAMLNGVATLPTALDPVSWHAHEFLFGYLGAVVAGFLLTAVPNWTGRLPIVGWPLGGLVALWVVGRLAVAFSADLPVILVAVGDLLFLVVLAAVTAREIIRGRNWRNLIMLALLGALILGNAVARQSG